MFNSPSSNDINVHLNVLRPRYPSSSPDGSTFLSCDLLNKSYEYVGYKHVESEVPDGYVLCECTDIFRFLTTYNCISVRVLKELAKAHGLGASDAGRHYFHYSKTILAAPSVPVSYASVSWVALEY